MKTLIDNLNFNNLDKYSSRSLVAWLKRETGTKEQQKVVKNLLEKRSEESLYKLKHRVQINYKLSESSSKKLKELCDKITVLKTFKISDQNILETNLSKNIIKPTDLVKAIVESKIEELWRSLK
tara:strand:+ start:423 stop:794 length:372 start_codon:yes stop_codon:yes gene_type:complete